MALSGTIETTDYNGRYIEFSWSAEQSIEDNESTITWTLYGRGKATHGFYKTAPVRVILNDDTKNYKFNKTTRFELWNGTYVGGGSFTIPHNNKGKASFKIKVEAAIYSGSVNCTGTKTFTLDDIPVKALVTKVPDSFNDEENPTMEFENVIGDKAEKLEVCISLTGERSDIAYRQVDINSTSYKFELTDDERKILRAATTGSNSRMVRFYVRTTIKGVTDPELHYLSSKYEIVNYNPTLNPTIFDNGKVSSEITGDGNIIIKGYNVISVDTGAAAVKEATLSSVKVTNGSKTLNSASGNMYHVETDTFTITAIDNRGNKATQTVKKTLINYFKPTCNLKVDIINAEGETKLKISGTCFIGSLGATNNDVSIQYRYQPEDGDFIEWITAAAGASNYDIEVPVTGLDYTKAYTFQARVIDTIYNADTEPAIESVMIKVKSIPVADWSKDDFNFNVKVNSQKSIIFPSGTEGIRGTNSDGEEVLAIQPSNLNDNLVIGYGNYDKQKGMTNIYGNKINMYSNEGVTIDGIKYNNSQILWEGAYYMTGTHTASFKYTDGTAAKASQQPNGIVLVFSAFSSGTAQDWGFHCFFVPKVAIATKSGKGHTFILASSKFDNIATKYLYISDDKITGNDANEATGTAASGIKYTNNGYVLRYVIGV